MEKNSFVGMDEEKKDKTQAGKRKHKKDKTRWDFACELKFLCFRLC
jgi:hypothetical protein